MPRRRQSGFSTQKLILVSGVLLLFFLFAVIAAQSIQQYRLREQLDEYQARIRESELRNDLAREEIERLHELSYIEMLARKYLGLVKPGDTVFLLED